MNLRPRASLSRDSRGVVYLETLVAFMPVFIFFLGTLQLADLSVAHLIVQHASSTAARAAVVVLPDDGAYYEDHENSTVHQFTGLRRADVELAADLVMQASPRLSLTSVELDQQSYVERQDLTATVKARYRCLISTFCGSGLPLESKTKLVYQGADFVYEPTTIGEVASVPRPARRPRHDGPPGDGTPGTPGDGTPGTPGDGTPGTPGDGTPGDGTPRAPGDGTPGTPGDGTPRTPGDGTPGTPGDGTPGLPGDGTPRTPGDGTPRTPGDGTPDPNGANPPRQQPGGDTPPRGTDPSTGNHPSDRTNPPDNRPGNPSNGTNPPNGSNPSNGHAGNPSNGTNPPNGSNPPNGHAATPPASSNPNRPISRPDNGTLPGEGSVKPGQVGTRPGQSPGVPSTIGTGRAPEGPTAGTTKPGSESRPSDGQNHVPTTGVPPAGTGGVVPGKGEPDRGGATGPVADSTRPPQVGAGSGSPRGPPTQNGTPGRAPGGTAPVDGSSSPLPIAGNVGLGPIASGPACVGPGCANGSGACFVAGTQVGTPSGSRSIESIAAGESVYAYDEARGEVVVASVVHAFDRKADALVDLTVRSVVGGDEQIITGTPDHPFFVPALGAYVPLGQLPEGAVLLTLGGEPLRVVSATARTGQFAVFNFTVEGKHNYFVGARASDRGILVHNACPPTPEEIAANQARDRATRRLSRNWRCVKCRARTGTTTFNATDHRPDGSTVTVPVTRSAEPVPEGATFIDGWRVPPNTTRVTYSYTDEATGTTHQVDYYLDAQGRTYRVEAPWQPKNTSAKAGVDSHVPGRITGGGLRVGEYDQRGHLAPEANAAAPVLVNVPENFIPESPLSNLANPNYPDNKRAWEIALGKDPQLRLCGTVYSCVTSHEVVHEDSSTGDRPAGAYHSVYVDGVKRTDLSWYVPNPTPSASPPPPAPPPTPPPTSAP